MVGIMAKTKINKKHQHSDRETNLGNFYFFNRKCPNLTKFRQKKAPKNSVNNFPILSPENPNFGHFWVLFTMRAL